MSILLVENALAKEAIEQQLVDLSVKLGEVTRERDELQATLVANMQGKDTDALEIP